MLLLFLVVAVVTVAILARVMRADLAAARAAGRPVLSLRDALRRS